jgi:hypothetical protein
VRTWDYLRDVQPVFGGCTGCHGSSGGLNLTASVSFANIVNRSAAGCSGEVRVIPGNATDSYLLQKVENRHRRGCGGSMSGMSGSQITTLRNWILDGAPGP